MALVKGINCGFVAVAPSGDPGGTEQDVSNRAFALRDITAGSVVKVTEIGWWCNDATVDRNYELGIYDHDSGADKPDVLVGVDTVNAKGDTAGWKRALGLNIVVSGSTIYWLAVQLDQVGQVTSWLYLTVGGEKCDYKGNQTQLVDPWGTSAFAYARLVSIYAVVESGEGNGEVHSGSLVKNGAALEAEPGLYV